MSATNWQQLARVLAQNKQGSTVRDLAAALDLPHKIVSVRLRDMSRAGRAAVFEVEAADQMRRWRWCLPQDANECAKAVQLDAGKMHMMSRAQARREAVLQVVRDMQPVRSVDIAARLGWPRDEVKYIATELQRVRRLAAVGVGTGAVWAIPGSEAQADAQEKLDARLRAKRGKEAIPADDDDGWQPRQVVVPANMRPVPHVAARSVFEWRP